MRTSKHANFSIFLSFYSLTFTDIDDETANAKITTTSAENLQGRSGRMDGLARLSRAIHEAWRSAVTITTHRLIALFQAQRALELETAEVPSRQYRQIIYCIYI